MTQGTANAGGRRVLVVEDDRVVALDLELWLRMNGYEVFAAYDTFQGLKTAAAERPDLVFADLDLPAGGGLNLAACLKRMVPTSRIPVLFFAESEDPDLRKRAESLTAWPVLHAPLGPEAVLMAVRRAIGAPTLAAAPQPPTVSRAS